MPFDPNPLYFEMCQLFHDHYNEDQKLVICNEGSTRSSKTWDTFHFIYTFCDHNRNQWNDIYILRETLVKCRDFTFKDFKKCMKVIGAKLSYKSEGAKPYVNIFGNNVYFRGMDSEEESEGYPSDIIYVNELLETDKTQFQGLFMRCRKLVLADWNPKYTKHWGFDLEGQTNTFFIRSTYKNNKHLSKSIVQGIEAMEPWETGSYYIENGTVMYKGDPVSDKNQPPPHIPNIDQGTADVFRWKVYGLGLRGAMKGLIFPHHVSIKEFPKDLAHVYGNDFGFTSDPNALVKFGQEGNNIYLELLSYTPMETEDVIISYLEALEIEKLTPIIADSSDKYVSEKRGVVEMVRGVRSAGYSMLKVSKTKSVMYWLLKMKTFKIHIVTNKFYNFAKTEAENYRMKEVHGIEINQPEDSFNHFWDAARYAFMSYNSKTTIWG